MCFVPHEHVKRVSHRLAKLAFTKCLLQHFRCTLLSPGKPPNFKFTKHMQILGILLDRQHKKSATVRLTLKRSFFVCVHNT